MIINHNMASINTNRQMGINNTNSAKSLEKLSSGLRINKAGDDAAGLAISEKMRGQIRGLDQAARNSQDGISLIQTGEGALSETHSILQRMRELAVQSSNGTNQNAVDRENINEEVQRLKEEVDRISESTSFNGIKLLNGSLSTDGSMKVGGSVLGKATVIGGLDKVTATVFKLSGGTTDSGTGAISLKSDAGKETAALNDVNIRFQLGSKDQDPTAFVDSDKNELVITLSSKQASNTEAKLQTAIGDAIKGSNLVYKDGANYYYKSTGDAFTTAGTDFKFAGFTALTTAADGIAVQSDIDELNKSLTREKGAAAVTAVEGFAEKFQIGDKVGNTLTIDFTQMKNADGETVNAALNGYTFKVVAGDKSYIQASVDENKKVITVGMSTVQSLNTDKNVKSALKGLTVNGYSLDDSNIKFDVTATGDMLDGTGKGLDTTGLVNLDSIAKDGLTFQIGSDASAEQRVKMNIEDMSTSGLKIDGVSMTTQKGSSDAITTIDKAINAVSKQRSNLGALQNRLEHTITNLGTSSENLTAAESRIRDVDMAKEMMQFQKNNILSQAAQAMLAQANQAPQGVLQLLR